jgi:hypothetical protein
MVPLPLWERIGEGRLASASQKTSIAIMLPQFVIPSLIWNPASDWTRQRP